jgi:DNA primase
MNAHVRAVTDFLKSRGILQGERPLGDNLMYRCPFHHGDSENFGIHESTGQWNCFKCKKRGRNAGDLMDALGIKDSGITAAQVYSFVDVRLEVMRAFEREVTDFSSDRSLVRVQQFPVTCGILESDIATSYIRGRGLDPDLVASMGTLYCPYGEYSRRIILPWFDGGKIIGFSARSVDNNDYVRKMLRPADSKQSLFLYNPTGRKIAGSNVVIVEGEFSAIATAHLGYHACGIFGSYLHPGQINLLIEAASVTLLLDGGVAGLSGMQQAERRLSGFVPSLRCVYLSGSEDPADVYARNPDDLHSYIERRPEIGDIMAQVKSRL